MLCRRLGAPEAGATFYSSLHLLMHDAIAYIIACASLAFCSPLRRIAALICCWLCISNWLHLIPSTQARSIQPSGLPFL